LDDLYLNLLVLWVKYYFVEFAAQEELLKSGFSQSKHRNLNFSRNEVVEVRASQL